MTESHSKLRQSEFVKFDTKRLLFWFRLAMTLGLLAVIFSRIDVARVLASLGRLRISYAMASLLIGYVMPILIMAWRWQLALRVLYHIQVPYRLLLRHYWTGLFVGYFVPGGVGADIYRAARMTSEPGGFKLNAAAIVGERVFAVFATGTVAHGVVPIGVGPVDRRTSDREDRWIHLCFRPFGACGARDCGAGEFLAWCQTPQFG